MKNPQILKIKTFKTKGWRDKDVVMLHACFQLLSDCIEDENERLLDGHIDWEHTKKNKRIKAEIEYLYHWWKERCIQDESVLDCDDKQYEEDNKMLIRLIKIRKHLWT